MAAPLTPDGRIAVPKRVQARLGLTPGAQVVFVLNDLGEVVLRRANAPAPPPPAQQR